MVNTCVAVGCKTNYHTCKEVLSTFDFPDATKFPDLLNIWLKFVNRPDEDGKPWKQTKNSKLCENHFEETFIKRCKKRSYLKWEMKMPRRMIGTS